eukprot:TRINITY_DN8777_c5_g1_i1.p1 TRINITY_DN8777_c5_g1~~TRINITY_DN8777_c5_g1_i1.p1  ORF type:complete len:403 (+),score=168.81 TRINITY_DN8777_c5_g1_i1:107-1210(+)
MDIDREPQKQGDGGGDKQPPAPKDDDLRAGGDESDEEKEEVVKMPSAVFVHSLPLLSTVDHHQRLQAGISGKRVVGVLLGANVEGRVNVTNSFAVPFEEDAKNPKIWYFDHHYTEDMFAMFKKVNAKEKIIGWYSTGPKLKQNDLAIHQLLRNYCQHPIYVIIRVTEEGQEEGIPTTAYRAVEKVEDERVGPKLTFEHLPTQLKCSPMEEVGVAHLLRDVTDPAAQSLQAQVKDKQLGLQSLEIKLGQMRDYLEMVAEGKLPVNNEVMYVVQDIFNTLPSLAQFRATPEMPTEVNDSLMVSYMGNIVRSVLALHNLIMNKFEMRRLKEESEQKKKDQEEKRQKELEEKKKKKLEEEKKKKKAGEKEA